MNMVALYDAKIRLSEICKQVSETGKPCVISCRGKHLRSRNALWLGEESIGRLWAEYEQYLKTTK